MKIGYVRVSTNEQSLDMQIDASKRKDCERIYEEKVSAVRDDRLIFLIHMNK